MRTLKHFFQGMNVLFQKNFFQGMNVLFQKKMLSLQCQFHKTTNIQHDDS